MHANARSWSDGVIAASRLARGTSIETTPRAILFTPAIQEETMVMILDEFKNKPEEDLIVALEKQQALEAEIRSLRAKVVEKHDIRFSELTDFMNQYKINKLNRR